MGPNGVPEKRAKIISEINQFSLILHQICSKTNRFTSFFTKLTRIKIWEQFFLFKWLFGSIAHPEKSVSHQQKNVGVKRSFLDVR